MLETSAGTVLVVPVLCIVVVPVRPVSAVLGAAGILVMATVLVAREVVASHSESPIVDYLRRVNDISLRTIPQG
jgi:hypothetical protein